MSQIKTSIDSIDNNKSTLTALCKSARDWVLILAAKLLPEGLENDWFSSPSERSESDNSNIAQNLSSSESFGRSALELPEGMVSFSPSKSTRSAPAAVWSFFDFETSQFIIYWSHII